MSYAAVAAEIRFPMASLRRLVSSLTPLATAATSEIPDAATTTEILTLLETVDLPEPALERARHHLSADLAASVIAHYHRRSNFALGFRFYVWASRDGAYCSRFSTQLVIAMMGCEGGFEQYWSALERARGHGFFIGPVAFITLIRAYNKLGMGEEAMVAFTRMKEFDCEPNVYTYNAVLHMLLRNDMLLLALSLYKDMSKRNHVPNVVTFNVLMHGFCRASRVADALQMFDEMIERGIAPNSFTDSIVLKVLCRAGRIDEARRLFEAGKGDRLLPGSVGYNDLIDGYCKVGRVDDALSFLRCSEREGFVMGVMGYNCLIDGLFKARRFVEAHEWCGRMVEAGIKKDVVSYCIMIQGLMDEGRVQEGMELLNQMSERGMVPNAHCYSVAIKGLCDAGLLDDARSLYAKITDGDRPPDVYHTTILISAMCRKRLVNEAEKLFKEMVSRGGSPSSVTFNALISGLCKVKDFKQAHLLVRQMEKGENPSLHIQSSQGGEQTIDGESLEETVEQLCESGQLVKAYRVLMKFTNNVVPCVRTYNTLIKGFCDAANINCAIKLFEDMPLKGLTPDSFTYQTLIDGLQRVDREDDAFNVFNKMITRGYTFDSSVYTLLMTWSSRRGKISLAFSVWLKYRCNFPGIDKEAMDVIEEDFKSKRLDKAIIGLLEMELKLNIFELAPYTVLIIGFCRTGKLVKALKIYTALIDHNVDVTPPCIENLIYGLCGIGMLDVATNICLGALERGYTIKKASNHLINALLRSRDKTERALHLINKIKASGLDVTSYLYPTTRLLLRKYLAMRNTKDDTPR